MTIPEPRRSVADVEHAIARLLLLGAVIGVAFLAIGVVLMALHGISPESRTFPAFDPGTLVPDLGALRPEAFLWVGILILIATPIARVIGELITFTMTGERTLAIVALGILGVIALSVFAGVGLGR